MGEVEELILDEIVIDKFTDDERLKLENLEDLIFLSLNECELKSLKNFPKLKNLI